MLSTSRNGKLKTTYYPNVEVPALKPGEETTLVVEITAPSSPGEYEYEFYLTKPNGEQFGDPLSCLLKVGKENNDQMIFPTLSTQDPFADDFTNSPTSPTHSGLEGETSDDSQNYLLIEYEKLYRENSETHTESVSNQEF
ncbi:hypothetical protein G6F56_012769 [Rhizopus delemar]|nr:hypothetical protein G6F56_012769 [Rhizopus delemar]